MSLLFDYVERLRKSTDTALAEVQKLTVPRFIDMGFKEVLEYDYNGNEYTIENGKKIAKYPISRLFVDTKNELVLSTTKLIIHIGEKSKKNLIFQRSAKTMVNKKEIKPFCLFINGRFIKWSDITIVSNYNKVYFKIKKNENIEYDTSNIKYLEIPYSVYYNEDGINIDGNDILFRFDKDTGLLTSVINSEKIIISINRDENLFFCDKFIPKEAPVEFFTNLDLGLSPLYKLTKDNFIIFKDGVLDIDLSVDINALNLVTINGNIDSKKVQFKVFYNMDTNTRIDRINDYSNLQEVSNILSDDSISEELREYIIESFNVGEFDNTKSYEDNIKEALKEILMYNPLLLNDYYKKSSRIITKTYTGAEINSRVVNGNLILLRGRSKGLDDYVVMFVNGRLYKYYYMVEYDTNKVVIPIIDIQENDSVELLYFKNCQNDITYITPIEDEAIPLDARLNNYILGEDLSNIKLYTSELPEVEGRPWYDLSEFPMAQYPVDFSITYDHTEVPGTIHANVSVTNNFYYGKTLAAVSENQFRYIGYTVTNQSINRVMSEEFKYCHNKDRYMIFVDGVKLNREQYDIILPEPGTPIYEIALYSNIGFPENSRVDILYLPFDYEELNGTIRDGSSNEKYIRLDGNNFDSIKDLRFSKELYLLFVNGSKININNIVNTDTNEICLVKYENDLIEELNDDLDLDICIVKYLSPTPIILDLVDADRLPVLDDEIFVNFMDIHPEIIQELKGNLLTILSKDDNIVPDKALIKKVIREYWLESGFHSTGNEEIDYEYILPIEAGEELDVIRDITILNVADANEEDNVQ